MGYTIKDLKSEVEGKDIYLIGGGTSFKPDEHIPLLPKEQVVCLNSALEDFDRCLAVMWMDGSWQGNNSMLLREKRHKYAICFNVSVQFLETKNRSYLHIRNTSCGKCDFGVKRKPYNVCGNNTGVTAIDLLDQLKAKRIYLLGFDCREENKRSNYHDRYKTYTKQSLYRTNFIPCFEKLSKNIKNSEVVNLSENSNIHCFRKARIESILGDN